MARVYITKPSTGAVWSSAMPELGMWRKESLGCKFHNTQQVGTITNNFFPFSRKNKKKGFVVINR
ncbi:hypothetical protein pf16_194 [Pseudomonas phage pf16]|uniref:Uncharacterized protein n=1 Tax=Pseudomonas phage pf16 TaxID=1815630 RepID=A0A1S5R3Y0_9CAUD|nr:hypothetical protein FDG98_gp104 [Pseudomonas phage pf16]AND75117.1 hypothetical protein pf16_194 [Pseudomonas phage pf16]